MSVIVTLKDDVKVPSEEGESANLDAQAALIERWRKTYDITVGRQLGYLVNAFRAEVPKSQIAELRADPAVASVDIERRYYPDENFARVLEGVTPEVEAAGVDGSGMVVAIVDTGIDIKHKDLQLSGEDCANAKITTIQPGFTCKVPAGYNYADSNGTVKDADHSPHGQHVAGIVGANGNPAEGGIKGVAPKAQLLAMKVFSNDGKGGAAESDILAAVEDSVKLGADVINMSLGSDNGTSTPSLAMSRLLDKVRSEGVLPVISAGNSGQNYSSGGGLGDVAGRFDDGTLGSPGSYDSAFTVASVENSTVTGSGGTLNIDGAETPVIYSHTQGAEDGEFHELVPAGLGYPEDFEDKDFTGKWALIERGELAFTDKFANAISAGAEGAVVYNHAAGGDAPPAMASIDDPDFVAVGIGNSDGVKILDAINSGKTVSISLSGEVTRVPNPTGKRASFFSSWGTTPTLDFKPEIAGIGGSVYSLQNDNTYASMSGTSMSSPNVAGLSALVLQHLKKLGEPGNTPATLDRAESLLVNTAERLDDPQTDLPYPIRQLGAGLARVDRAVASSAVATVDGDATLALHEVNEARSFTVTVENFGDEDLDFTVPGDQPVYTETNTAGEETTTSAASESTLSASASTVHVPAKGSATVTFTLTPKGAEGYVEGWATLVSTTESQPDLAVPYFGFHGDWNKEPIIATKTNPYDSSEPSLANVFTHVDIATAEGSWEPIDPSVAPEPEEGEDPQTETHFLSPNGDGFNDAVGVAPVLLRNAEEIRYEILTKDGKHVRSLGASQDNSRVIYSDASTAPEKVPLDGTVFDGTILDPSTFERTPIAEGEYVFRIQARLGKDWEWQNYDQPFTVDLTAPTVTVTGPDADGRVTIEVHDERTSDADLPFPEVAINNDEILDSSELESLGNGTWAFTLVDPEEQKFAVVTAADQGMNQVTVTKSFDATGIDVLDREALEEAIHGVTDPDYEAAGGQQYRIVAGDAITSVVLNGGTIGETTLTRDANGVFTGVRKYEDGLNTIDVIAKDASDDEVARDTISFIADTKPPVLTVTNVNEDGTIDRAADGSFTVEGTVTQEKSKADDLEPRDLSVTVLGNPADIDENGHFSVTVDDELSLFLVDLFGIISVGANDGEGVNEVSQVYRPSASVPADNGAAWSLSSTDCSVPDGMCVISRASKDVEEVTAEDGTTSGTLTLAGTVSNEVTSVAFVPGRRAMGVSTYTPETPIEAAINRETGTFEVKLPGLQTGIHSYRIEVRAGDEVIDEVPIRIFYDITVPKVSFDTPPTPELLNGALHLGGDGRLTLKGSVFDDGFGYVLGVNADVLADVHNYTTIGRDYNGRDFEYGLSLKGGDLIGIHATDALDNTVIGIVPIVVDGTAPTFADLPESRLLTLEGPRDLTFTAEDANIEDAAVLVDGKPIDAKKAPVERGNLADALTVHSESEDESTAGSDASGEERQARSATDSASEESANEAAAEATADALASDATIAEDGTVDSTASATTSLTVTVPASELSSGRHTVQLVARDLSGNETTEELAVVVDTPVSIDGPDTVSLEAATDGGDADQAALAQALLARYTAVDPDGAYDASGTPVEGEPTLRLAAGTTLRPGTQDVTIIATDAAGHEVTRTVTVTVTVPKPAEPETPVPTPGEDPKPGTPLVPAPGAPTTEAPVAGVVVTPTKGAATGKGLAVTGASAGESTMLLATALGLGGALLLAGRSRARSRRS